MDFVSYEHTAFYFKTLIDGLSYVDYLWIVMFLSDV